MGKKIGRNEPCWCGSGLKYKRCHLNREIEERPNPRDAERELYRAYSKKVCSVPKEWADSCVGGPIRAHTVPKSAGLRRIAREGHVYGYKPSFQKLSKHKGKVPAELLGINLASTFTGFCGKHDNELFAPLEVQTFAATQEQCFLLAYRAFSREAYTKRAAATLSEVRRNADKGLSESDQFEIQSTNLMFDVGLAAGLRDNESHLTEFEYALLSGDYTSVRAYVIELEKAPPVMCSGGIFPERTFDGHVLQKLEDVEHRGQLLTISSFADNEKGYVVFSWLPNSDEACISFIESLEDISDDDLASALLRMFFEYLENVFISPDWWDSLDPHHCKYLDSQMWSIVDQLAGTKKSGDIRPDRVTFDPWPIVRRMRVGEFG